MTAIALAALAAFPPPAVAGAQQASHSARSASTKKPEPVKKPAPRTAASAAPWKEVYRDRTVAVSIEPALTRRGSDGTYRTHLRWRYTSPRSLGGRKSYTTMVEDRLVDCTSLGSKTLAARAYDSRGREAAHLSPPGRDERYMNWATRPRGSSAARALAAVCASITRS